MHLFHNKHELTFVWVLADPPMLRLDANDLRLGE